MKNTPLYNALCDYRNKNMISFHTPGHKNKDNILLKDIYSLDFTELLQTDSLFNANGCILEAENKISFLYNAKKTLISPFGCTSCIQTMLRLVAPCGGEIITPRVIHQSAINTMALLKQNPIWVYPDDGKNSSFNPIINKEDIEKIIIKNKNAKAVYLTSPDYYGNILDIKGISKVCKKYNIPLIVDGAHGTHLRFIDKNLDPGNLGTSMVACSAHKTLPVLTGGAWLNIYDEKYCEDAKTSMMLFSSTSPSYPIMASIDICRNWLEDEAYEKISKTVKISKEIKNLISNYSIEQPLGEVDPFKITFNTLNIGLNARYVAEFFMNKKIEPEYFDERNIIFIISPFNTEEDFCTFQKALHDLPKNKPINNTVTKTIIPKIAMKPNDAIFMKSEYIKTENSLGKIINQNICPCPPGVALTVPGEIITKDLIELLLTYGIYKIKVLY